MDFISPSWMESVNVLNGLEIRAIVTDVLEATTCKQAID